MAYWNSKSFSFIPLVAPIVWIIPAIVLILGVSTIVMAILGCYGMAIENKACSISYFVIHIVILLAEIAVGAYWLVRSADSEGLITTRASFGEYSMDKTVQWTQMQMEMNCCGASDAYDYSKRNFSVPTECCIPEPSISTYRLLLTVFDKPCQAAYVQKKGCDQKFVEAIREERIVIAAFCFVGALMKIVVLTASFLIPFEEIVEEIGWSPVGSLVWGRQKDKEEETTEV